MPSHTQGINPLANAIRLPEQEQTDMQALPDDNMFGMPPNVWEAFKQKLDSLATPEEKEEYVRQFMTDWQAQAGDAQDAMARADSLQPEMPQGRNAGGVYRAGNPLEFLSTALRGRKQNKAFDTANTTLGTARAGANDTRYATADAMLQQPADPRVNALRAR